MRGSDLTRTLIELHGLLVSANEKLGGLSMIDDGKLLSIRL